MTPVDRPRFVRGPASARLHQHGVGEQNAEELGDGRDGVPRASRQVLRADTVGIVRAALDVGQAGVEGESMLRYVHNELTMVVQAVCAVAISAPVTFGMRGTPKADAGWSAVFIALSVVSTLSGVLACTRSTRVDGGKRDFERAVPLNPDTVLPTLGKSLPRSLALRFIAFLVVPTLIAALFWEPWMAIMPLVLVPERLAKAAYAAYWERRHGVMLWRGHVPDQPLEKGQYLYSSVRQPTP